MGSPGRDFGTAAALVIAEGCRGLEIDDKLVSERELNRQIAWACAAQNPVNVRRCRSHEFELVDAIGHQTPALGIEAERIYRGQPEPACLCNDEVTLRCRQCAWRYDQAAATPCPKADKARSMLAALRTSAAVTERPNEGAAASITRRNATFGTISGTCTTATRRRSGAIC
jgi:hypothetical protein